MNVPEPYTFSRPFVPLPYLLEFSGMGRLRTTGTQQDISMATSAAASVGGTIGTIVGGPVLGAAVNGAIQAAGALANVIAGIFSGCGQSCVATSHAANQVAQLLTQNVQNYIAAPIHTEALQAAALAAFDNAWAQLQQFCGNPTYGSAGQRCITDRQRGACQAKTSPGGWQQDSSGNWTYVWAGQNGSGSACWNWFVGMRDPIANDPTVVPDSVLAADNITVTPAGQVVSTSGSTPAATSSMLIPLAVIAALALVFLL